MSRLKIFSIFFLLMVSPTPALAQHHIGNGGGDPEISVLKMFSALRIWNDVCLQHPGVCWSNSNGGQKISLEIQKAFAAQEIKNVLFASAIDAQNSRSGASLLVSRDELYLQNGDSKSELELGRILIQALLDRHQADIHIGSLRLQSIPRVQSLTELGLASVPVASGEYVFAINDPVDLQTNLLGQLKCSGLNVVSNSSGSFQVRCLGARDIFSVFVKSSNPWRLQVRFDLNE